MRAGLQLPVRRIAGAWSKGGLLTIENGCRLQPRWSAYSNEALALIMPPREMQNAVGQFAKHRGRLALLSSLAERPSASSKIRDATAPSLKFDQVV